MRDREREAETQAEGEAGSMQEPDAGLDPGTPGSRPGPQAVLGAEPPGGPSHVTFCAQSYWAGKGKQALPGICR